MNVKRMKKGIAVLLAFLLILLVAHIRVIHVSDQPIVLFHKPSEGGGASAGNDIRAAFTDAGMSSDRVFIRYIGTSTDGDYFLCEYTEADGSVTEYYAFDDSDHNSGIRATVLWP